MNGNSNHVLVPTTSKKLQLSAKASNSAARRNANTAGDKDAVEPHKVKELYSQLQEKSTELTSLLDRLKAIID